MCSYTTAPGKVKETGPGSQSVIKVDEPHTVGNTMLYFSTLLNASDFKLGISTCVQMY